MKRYVSACLPWWPSQRHDRNTRRQGQSGSPDDDALALVIRGAGGQRLHAVNRTAARLGLTPGLTLTDARARVPALVTAPADDRGDIRALTALARWSGRWSPVVAPDPAGPGLDGLILDITGCTRLFGGETALLDAMMEGFAELGFSVRLAAAPTIGLAWGAARFDPDSRNRPLCIDPDTAADRLAALPVEALRLAEGVSSRLRALGLTRAGLLLQQPRAALARRFGLDLPRRLDQARGQESEPLDPIRPARAFRSSLRFAEPVPGLDPIKTALPHLVGPVCDQLTNAGRGARRLVLSLVGSNGRAVRVAIGTAAAERDSGHIIRLLGESLDRLEADFGLGVEALHLTAPSTAAFTARQARLDGTPGEEATSHLVDRLRLRLGETGVRRAASRESWFPERASGWRTADHAQDIYVTTSPGLPLKRPLLLLDRPEPVEALAEVPDGPPRVFVWRRVRHRIAHAEGPERIAPEWWRPARSGQPLLSRDYFHVETAEGHRFWLYRAGLYGRETDVPCWFVHGVS